MSKAHKCCVKCFSVQGKPCLPQAATSHPEAARPQPLPTSSRVHLGKGLSPTKFDYNAPKDNTQQRPQCPGHSSLADVICWCPVVACTTVVPTRSDALSAAPPTSEASLQRRWFGLEISNLNMPLKRARYCRTPHCQWLVSQFFSMAVELQEERSPETSCRSRWLHILLLLLDRPRTLD